MLAIRGEFMNTEYIKKREINPKGEFLMWKEPKRNIEN